MKSEEKQEPIYQYMNVSLMDETWLQERWIDCSKEEFDARNSECEPTRRVYAQQQPVLVEGLHPETADLVMSFAEALARKLRKSEQKYGWSDGWKDSDWQEKCIADFHHHIGKGDPLDVAAYCAFMVYHDWSTRPAPAINLAELVPDRDESRRIFEKSCHINNERNPHHPDFYLHLPVREKWDTWEACRAAILRNIEESK